MIERCTSIEQSGWLLLREALWPHGSREEHLTEMSSFISNPDRHVPFVAYTPSRLAVGLVEASLRSDYVNGTDSLPVAFLEGIYVAAEHRRQGIAAQLVDAVAAWATSLGCQEFASDAPLENELSHQVGWPREVRTSVRTFCSECGRESHLFSCSRTDTTTRPIMSIRTNP